MTDYEEKNTKDSFQSYYQKPKNENFDDTAKYDTSAYDMYESETKDSTVVDTVSTEWGEAEPKVYDEAQTTSHEAESSKQPEKEPSQGSEWRETQSPYNVEKVYVEDEKKKKGFAGSFMSYVAVIVITALLSGFAGSFFTRNMFVGSETSGEVAKSTITIDGNVENVAQAVAKKAEDSVVAVTSINTRTGWFGTESIPGMGSGIIISEDGYVLTNSHVIEGGEEELKVFLSDQDIVFSSGTTSRTSAQSVADPEKTGYPAKIIWDDAKNDVALIKIDAGKKLQAAELGDSSKVEVGETVIAIGNPINVSFKSTVTQGIISGLNREVTVQVESDQQYDNPFYRYTVPQTTTNTMTGLIQTDAAINNGNSGGPLLNSKGQVIGINTVKASSNGVEGLGFAIPINNVKSLVAKLETGDFRTVLLGVYGYSVKEYEEMVKMSVTPDEGFIVMQIMENSPAAKAGIQSHDIITEMNGEKISSIDEIRNLLSSYKLNDKGEISFYRSGEKKTVNIVFDQYSDAVQTPTPVKE